MPTRRQTLTGLAALVAALGGPFPLRAAPTDDEVVQAIRGIYAYLGDTFDRSIEVLRAHGAPDVASALILALRYTPNDPDKINGLLREITGHDAEGWFEWMLWQERNPDVSSHPIYYDAKRRILLGIDERWTVFLRPEFTDPGEADIRFEEIVWGGAVRDGIPSLDNPTLIGAVEAAYLNDDDLVFGVEINGDVRAYPLRIMGWHEMFNEVIGGVPMALAYCTLCGAGILFETSVEGFDEPLVMASSGLLYRSNKLMYDRTTESLWNQFTGEPVSGALRGSGIKLAQRPVAIERWGEWRARHPDTMVLSVETGFPRDYGPGVVYRDYFASPDLMFPAAAAGPLAKKDYVFGVRTFGASKAWPLAAFGAGRVINDQVGVKDIVLTGSAAGRNVRAYDREGIDFAAGPEAATLIGDGQTWAVTEAALVGEDGRRLGRVAGHVAYWFAWNSYHGPETTLYDG